ncbi:MAG: AAA family ATPase [Clostridiales bacterium]|nr:AAA family ATPase [Clostridiales bacterium]
MNTKIPYGMSDYSGLVEEGGAYIDKTEFIELLENSVNFITFFRPRRFGKTLFISTLQYYYDYKYSDRFDELFGGTYIGAHPTPLRNKFAILRFDFSGIETSEAEKTQTELKQNVIVAINDFIASNAINVTQRIDTETSPALILKQFLYYAAKNFKHPVYILIDEYDHFANNMLGAHFSDFKEAVNRGGFVRCFFETLKEGAGINVFKRIFITGVSPITKDSLTSGFNIALNFTRRLSFHEMAGFTRDEVAKLIDETIPSGFNKEAILKQMASLYDGYNFVGSNAQKIFNSSMVLYFLEECRNNGKPPIVLLDSNVLSDYSNLKALASLDLGESSDAGHKQIAAAKERREEALMSIIKGEPQLAKFTEVFNLKEYDHNDFLSLLFYTGFLTIQTDMYDKVSLILPNAVIKSIFCDYFANMYLGPTLGMNNKAYEEAMLEMSSKGKNDLFVKCLADILGLAPDRIYLNFSEKHFQFLGYIVARGYTGYRTEMEKDVGYGHVDLAFLPSEIPVNYYAFEELKYIKARDLNHPV